MKSAMLTQTKQTSNVFSAKFFVGLSLVTRFSVAFSEPNSDSLADVNSLFLAFLANFDHFLSFLTYYKRILLSYGLRSIQNKLAVDCIEQMSNK